MNEGLTSSGISKRFGESYALKDVSFEVLANERVLLVGPNGAGKTTLLKLLSRLSRPDSGKILGPSATISWCGAFLYGALTAAENLRMVASISGSESKIEKVIDRLGLEGVKEMPVSDLSKGYLQRTSLARAFLGRSSYILLDEPTSFLDDKGVDELTSLLLESQKGIVIATHDVARLKSVATRIIVLLGGRVALDTGPDADTLKKEDAINAFYANLK